MVKDINITSETTKETKVGLKHEVLDGKVKYGFFHNKSEKGGGGETRAYQQWKQFELGAGMKVRAEIKEEPGKFTNTDGEEIKFTNRTILWFEGDEHDVPYTQKLEKNTTGTFKGDVDITYVKSLEARVKHLEDTIFGTEKAVSVEDGINPGDLPF